MLNPESTIIDIRDFAYIPTRNQYDTYRSVLQAIGRSFHKTQQKLQEYYSQKSKMVRNELEVESGVSDAELAHIGRQIARLNRHLSEYGRYSRIIGECMNLEEDLIGIMQPIRLYCELHFTYYYIISNSTRYVELQNKYKEYLEIRYYIESHYRR